MDAYAYRANNVPPSVVLRFDAPPFCELKWFFFPDLLCRESVYRSFLSSLAVMPYCVSLCLVPPQPYGYRLFFCVQTYFCHCHSRSYSYLCFCSCYCRYSRLVCSSYCVRLCPRFSSRSRPSAHLCRDISLCHLRFFLCDCLYSVFFG